MEKVLVLDQATTTGWSFYKRSQKDYFLVESGKFTVSSPKLPNFKEELEDLVIAFQPDKIVYEGIQQQRNVQTFKVLAFFQAAIILVANEHKILVEEIYVSQWRRIVQLTGTNRTEKERRAREMVKEHFDIEATTDEAEAILIGLAYCKMNMSAF